MNTKIIFTIIIIVFTTITINAQVAINSDNTTAAASAMLDVKSTIKGILIPRMSTLERTSINTPADGLIVYDKTTNSFWYFDSGNSGWTELVTKTGATKIDELSDGRTDTTSIFLGTNTGKNDDGSNNNIALGIESLMSNTSGQNNVAIGNAALSKNISKVDNVAIGDSALFNNGQSGAYFYGSKNTAIGKNALFTNTDGFRNTALGYNSMYQNTKGFLNTSIGERALFSNTEGDFNTALGSRALYSNTVGEENCAIGKSAMYYNTTGSKNTAMGLASMAFNKSGHSNTAIGHESLMHDTTGNNNTAIGTRSLYYNRSGSSNTAIGKNALHDNTTGNNNVAIGSGSLSNSTTAFGNVAIGNNSLSYDTTGQYNTACGEGALHHNRNGNNNNAFGLRSMYFNTTGSSNVAIGNKSLYKNTTVSGLVAIGDSALFNNGDGATGINDAQRNTAIGTKALFANTHGHSNTAIGYKTLSSHVSNSLNTAVGSYALHSDSTGHDNTATGNYSLGLNKVGAHNTAAGSSSIYNNTTGNSNTGMGSYTLFMNTSGNNNVAVGQEALFNNFSGNNNTAIGYKAGYGNWGIIIEGCVYIGYRAGENNYANNKLFIDNSNTASPLIGGDFSANRVDINGRIKITEGNPGSGKVLTSDANGLASWTSMTEGASELNELNDAKTNSSSVFLGTNAGANTNSNGVHNVAIGLDAFKNSAFTDYNIAIGTSSLYHNTYADHVIAIGDSALFNNGSSSIWGNEGNYNIAIGDNALMTNDNNSGNIAIGHRALKYVKGTSNTVIGYAAGESSLGVDFNNCVMIGREAGASNTSDNRLFIDNSSTSTPLIGGDFSSNQVDINGTLKITGGAPGAGKVLTSDVDGLASWTTLDDGVSALNDLSDAYTDGSNIFVGAQVGGNDNGGNYNTIFGDEAFKNNVSGKHNTGFGYKTLEVNTGGSNSAFGISSLRQNTSGANNVALGFEAMYYNQTGSSNVAIGYEAGKSTSGNSLSGCVFLGYQAGKSNNSNNKLFIDNSSTSTPLIGGDFSSDELYFNASKVGIGTNAPNELFEVANSSGVGRMIVSDGQGSNRRTLLFVSPSASYNYARIESYKYGSSSGGIDLRINMIGGGRTIFGGNVEPDSHKDNNLGSNTKAWDNVYADDYITLGSAAFANISVTQQIINFPPQEKKEGAFDEFTDKGAKELDPASLPASLTENNALLIDEITTYNYKANYEQQVQLDSLKAENNILKQRIVNLETATTSDINLKASLQTQKTIIEAQQKTLQLLEKRLAELEKQTPVKN